MKEALEEVNACFVFASEGALLKPIAPLAKEDVPGLALGEEAKSVMSFSIEAVIGRIYPSGLNDLAHVIDPQDCVSDTR